jgi:hypothetical protein
MISEYFQKRNHKGQTEILHRSKRPGHSWTFSTVCTMSPKLNLGDSELAEAMVKLMNNSGRWEPTGRSKYLL